MHALASLQASAVNPARSGFFGDYRIIMHQHRLDVVGRQSHPHSIHNVYILCGILEFQNKRGGLYYTKNYWYLRGQQTATDIQGIRGGEQVNRRSVHFRHLYGASSFRHAKVKVKRH